MFEPGCKRSRKINAALSWLYPQTFTILFNLGLAQTSPARWCSTKGNPNFSHLHISREPIMARWAEPRREREEIRNIVRFHLSPRTRVYLTCWDWNKISARAFSQISKESSTLARCAPLKSARKINVPRVRTDIILCIVNSRFPYTWKKLKFYKINSIQDCIEFRAVNST